MQSVTYVGHVAVQIKQDYSQQLAAMRLEMTQHLSSVRMGMSEMSHTSARYAFEASAPLQNEVWKLRQQVDLLLNHVQQVDITMGLRSRSTAASSLATSSASRASSAALQTAEGKSYPIINFK